MLGGRPKGGSYKLTSYQPTSELADYFFSPHTRVASDLLSCDWSVHAMIEEGCSRAHCSSPLT